MSQVDFDEVARALRAIPDFENRRVATEAWQVILGDLYPDKFNKTDFYCKVMMA